MTSLTAVFAAVLAEHATWRPGGRCVCGERLDVDGITKAAHDEAHRLHVAHELIVAGRERRAARLADQEHVHVWQIDGRCSHCPARHQEAL